MIILYFLFEKLSKVIGVPLQIYLDEPITINHHYYEEETDTLTTGFGYAAMFISIMISARIGMAFNTIDFRGGVSKKGEYEFLAWVFGLMTYGAASATLFALWRNFHGVMANIFFNVIDGGILLLVFIKFKNWRDKKLASLRQEEP